MGLLQGHIGGVNTLHPERVLMNGNKVTTVKPERFSNPPAPTPHRHWLIMSVSDLVLSRDLLSQSFDVYRWWLRREVPSTPTDHWIVVIRVFGGRKEFRVRLGSGRWPEMRAVTARTRFRAVAANV